MTLNDELKNIIDDYYCQDDQELNLQQLETLKQQLQARIEHERFEKKLFTVMREDPRDNLRVQFKILKNALSGDGIEIEDSEDGSPRREDDVIRWDIYRRSDPTDRAVLKLTPDNAWSIGISYPKKSDLHLTSLSHLLSRNRIDLYTLGEWKFDK